MSEALKRMAAEYRANAGLLLKRINELKSELARMDAAARQDNDT